MEKIIKEIEARIKAIKGDKYIDKPKQGIIIRENERVLAIIKKHIPAEIEKSERPELDREFDTGRIGVGSYEYED